MTHSAHALHILCVDDDPANRGVFSLILRGLMIGDRPIVVSTARDGAEALEKWQWSTESSESTFDLIFMDCCMPNMDGYEATRHIREQEGVNRRVAIVGLTALMRSSDRDTCLQAGMDDYLIKPVSIEDLSKTVLKWLPQILQQRQVEKQA